MMQRATDAGVSQFYLPGIDAEVIDSMLKMEQEYPGKCKAMIGLHPCSVNESMEEELLVVKHWLSQRKFPAIGEIGLDFYWDKTFVAQQQHAFDIQMNWALEFNLPIVIHTRNAMDETIAAVTPFAQKGLRGIFHCFSGNGGQAQKIVELGFSLGIGGVVTYKNSGLAESLAGIGLQHIVLETDAPYLTPVPHRGKRNESSYLPIIAAKLAEIYKTSLDQIAAQTTANAASIFAY